MLALSVLPAPARQRWRRPRAIFENQMWDKCEQPCRSDGTWHFCVSAARKAANACGEPGRTSAPSLAKAAVTCGDAKLSLIAELNLMTMPCGVPAGATTPIYVNTT